MISPRSLAPHVPGDPPRRGLAWLLLALAAAAPPAVAAAASSLEDSTAQTVVIDAGGQKIDLAVEDGMLVVTTDEDGHVRTATVNVAEIGTLVSASLDEALDGLDGVLADLGEMQFQMRLGQDNRLNLAYDDTEFEIDLDQVMSEIAAAVELGLAEMDVDRWSSARPRGGEPTEDELRRELAALQQEMRELRRELSRLQDAADDR
jgi:hypothetical protein